jgi:hypothetical protein
MQPMAKYDLFWGSVVLEVAKRRGPSELGEINFAYERRRFVARRIVDERANNATCAAVLK